MNISHLHSIQMKKQVVITTMKQRDKVIPVTAKTLPCQVTQSKVNPNLLEIILLEGRNRQIRKMAESVGLNVVQLHRVMFSGITLKGLGPNEWLELNEKEISILQNAIEESEEDK